MYEDNLQSINITKSIRSFKLQRRDNNDEREIGTLSVLSMWSRRQNIKCSLSYCIRTFSDRKQIKCCSGIFLQWGGPGPWFEPRPGGPEAGTLPLDHHTSLFYRVLSRGDRLEVFSFAESYFQLFKPRFHFHFFTWGLVFGFCFANFSFLGSNTSQWKLLWFLW